MIFAEAQRRWRVSQVHAAVKIPVLANITEFGKTPLFTTHELKSAGRDSCYIRSRLPRDERRSVKNIQVIPPTARNAAS